MTTTTAARCAPRVTGAAASRRGRHAGCRCSGPSTSAGRRVWRTRAAAVVPVVGSSWRWPGTHHGGVEQLDRCGGGVVAQPQGAVVGDEADRAPGVGVLGREGAEDGVGGGDQRAAVVVADERGGPVRRAGALPGGQDLGPDLVGHERRPAAAQEPGPGGVEVPLRRHARDVRPVVGARTTAEGVSPAARRPRGRRPCSALARAARRPPPRPAPPRPGDHQHATQDLPAQSCPMCP